MRHIKLKHKKDITIKGRINPLPKDSVSDSKSDSKSDEGPDLF